MNQAIIIDQDRLDAGWFFQHPDRKAHIREAIWDECQDEFRKLGYHPFNRRRILLWRIPKNNPFFDPNNRQIMKIPFLAFADETIEDTDDILLPILHDIMKAAAHG